MRRSCIALAILAIFVGSSSLRAATTFSYDYVAGTPGQTTYTGSPGNYSVYTSDSLIIPIFLRETVNGGTTASLIASDNGLQGAGFRVSSTSSPTSTAITSLTANDGAGSATSTFDSGFTSLDSGTPSNQSLEEGRFGSTGVLPAAVSSTVYTVYLGNVNISAGTAAGVTTFTTDRRGMVSGNTVTVTHDYDLDAAGTSANSAAAGAFGPSNSSTFTVTTLTPEPTGLGVLAIGGAALLRRRRRA